MHIDLLHHLLLASDSCSNGIMGPNTPGLYDHLCAGVDVHVSALSDVTLLIANVVRLLLWLAGSLGVVFIIVGGIYYVTSAGNPSALKRAKEIITNVVVGLGITIAAYAVVTFISGNFN